ncbi:PrsW family intramembrane metalloprotease [Roseibium album]|uniref:PrsW family intramembrane metalloprotease n=1 Tax=Roseibium album TaxID=311410 RepID=UPI0032994734
MSNSEPPKQSPTPRDYKEPTVSELVPFRSKKINLLKSPLLWVIGGTGIIIVLMYSSFSSFLKSPTINEFMFFGLILIGWIILSILITIYLYSRTDRPVWHFLIPAAFVYACLTTPLGQPYFIVFRGFLDPNWMGNPSFALHFVYMFFAAGLMEELMKVTTVIVGAILAVNYTQIKNSNPKLFEILVIRGPLDGLLMGTVGGAMFIFVETGFQYFPQQFAKQATAETLLSGLMLLLPRTISGMVGHMGWAGITGYFIGLWVIRPGSWKFVVYAWIVVSALHAAWNSQSHMALLAPLSVAATAVLYVSCLLKARQIESRFGTTREDYGSIVVQPGDRPSPAQPAAAPPGPAHSPVRETPVQPRKAPGEGVFLVVGNTKLPVVAGQEVDFSPLAAMGTEGLAATVSVHPTRADVIGLKNTGTRHWKATLRDGKHTELEPGRNVRLAKGVTIEFGPDLVANVEEPAQ